MNRNMFRRVKRADGGKELAIFIHIFSRREGMMFTGNSVGNLLHSEHLTMLLLGVFRIARVTISFAQLPFAPD